MNTAKKIFISTGEISGDLHASKLVQALKKLNPNLIFYGIGHEKLKAEGVNLIDDLTTASTIGILEPILHLPKIISSLNKAKKFIKEEKPDLVITVDYQGFHLLLLKAIRELNIPAVYYIAPQEWQWGTKKGGQKVVDVTDLILAIYPEEAKFYQELGAKTTYIGHPLLDIVKEDITKEEFYHQLNIPKNKKIISIFPGSRAQELKLTFPILLSAAKELKHKYSDLAVIVSIASPKFAEQIKNTTKKVLSDAYFYQGNSYNLINSTYFSLSTSGTITLEHALLGTPAIVGYKFGKFSALIIRLFFEKALKEKVKFLALPSIILKEKVLPEFLQEEFTIKNVLASAELLLNDQNEYNLIKANLLKVRQYLGKEGVIDRAGTAIIDLLKVDSKENNPEIKNRHFTTASKKKIKQIPYNKYTNSY